MSVAFEKLLVDSQSIDLAYVICDVTKQFVSQQNLGRAVSFC